MKNNCSYYSKYVLIVLMLCFLAANFAFSQFKDMPSTNQSNSNIDKMAVNDLAKRLNTSADSIKVVEKKEVTSPNSSLGLPKLDEMSLQVLTPGYLLKLKSSSRIYLYTASERTVEYAGPESAWKYSILFTRPAGNKTDLDLYQCSFLGTNCEIIISGIIDYYPQSNGDILATKKTSDSLQELIYISAKNKKNHITLAKGTNFDNAAINESTAQWAAVQTAKSPDKQAVIVGELKADTNPISIELPDRFKLSKLAWSENKLAVLGTIDSKTVSYTIVPDGANKAWDKAAVHSFPGIDSFILNRSENLEIVQIDDNGTPNIEVATVWFTGKRKVAAIIKNASLKDCNIIDGEYAIIWGELESKNAVYIVNYRTGEIVSALTRNIDNAKFYKQPVAKKPADYDISSKVKR
jgi:hypothetical protein